MAGSRNSSAVELQPRNLGGTGQALIAGRFLVVRQLKQGGGVETCLGRDLVDQQLVVIKRAAGESLSAGAQMRVEHEAGVLRQVRCPWVAPLLHLGREDGQFYLVMPFIAGATLEKRLARGPLSVLDTLTVGRCLMEALREVHDHGVVHRDLKPANLIVNKGLPVRSATVIDFGLAWSTRLDAAVRDCPVGTVRYTSPEQAGLLGGDADERSDLYSAGAVLFECLAGRPPFLGETIGEVLRQHMTVRPPELRSLGLAVPRVLDEILQRLMRKDPRDRYQSAAAVLPDLALLADALGRGTSEPTFVVGARDRRRTLTEPAFVGRERELAALDNQLHRVKHGEGGVVLLEAESGGGKSRLLAEVAQHGARQGAWVLRGQGLDQAAQRPFQVLAGVAASAVAAARNEPALGARLAEHLGEQRQTACAALPELVEVLGTQTDARLGPETFGQVRTLQALEALLDALGTAERPALILLDDCQWADELSLSLLRRWQRSVERRARSAEREEDGSSRSARHAPSLHVLLVVAFRSEEVAADHALRGLQPVLHVRLAPFENRDLRRLAESMAGPLPDDALAAVERLSEGSPFMAAAVLQGLVESGALVPEDAGNPGGNRLTLWRTNPLALAEVQSSRHAAAFLARRIELLPPNVLSLLTAGAVLGKEFDLSLAANLAKQAPGEAVAALDEARRRHVVWARDQDTHCAFLHDKLRQTLLDRLPASDGQELHRRAALLLESNRSSAPNTFDLAYHFDAAGEAARALPYALAAADEARSRHSLEVAEQQYRIARRAVPETDAATRFRVAEGLGDVLLLRGRYDEAARELEAALGLAAGDVPRARVEGKLGELAFKRGDVRTAGDRVEQALRLLGKRVPRSWWVFCVLVLWEVLVQTLHTLLPRLFLARRTLDDAEPELLALRLYSRLCHLYWFHRGTVPSLWAHLREMNRAERYPPTLELAQAYSEHAPAMSLLAWFDRGIVYAEKSLAIRKQLGDVWGQGQSLHFHGVVLYAASRYRECVGKCREAIRLLERTGDQWEMNIARYQIAASLYRLGDLREAVAEARRMYQSGLELGDAQASGISLDTWARAGLGRVPADVIDAELRRKGGDVQRTAQVLAAEGARLLYAGQPAEAAGVFEQAITLVRQAGVRNAWVSPLYPWLATALRTQTERTTDIFPQQRRALLGRARAAVRRALRVARSFRNDLPHALREAGLVAALEGRPRRARRLFDESVAEALRQEARHEHAQTLLARGRVGLEAGWPGAADDLAQGRQSMTVLEAGLAAPADETAGTVRPATLSLADRFDNVLGAGRQIASALSRDAIFAAIRETALTLLRGERCLILKVDVAEGGHEPSPVSGELATEFSRTRVRQALARGRAMAFVERGSESASESVLLSTVRSGLCAPFYVRGQAAGCLYVTHRQVAGLFDEEEERLADFIAAIAGAALENAEGFAELHRLNRVLEQGIAEAKRAEKQIQEQAALLDKAQDAITVQDLDDRVLYWNQSAERLYGWTSAEALGRRVSELVERGAQSAERQDGNAPRSALCAPALRATGEWAGELRQTTRAGKAIIVESRWTLVRDEAGLAKAWLVVSTDVTEKKKLEAQFLRAQRMESIGTLAGGIAHDINNLLTPILMGVDLLATELPRGERLSLLRDLKSSAQRGADMVKQILSFARGVEGERVPLQPRHILAELEKMLRRTFPKAIAIETNLPRELWCVSGDPTQLYQMLMNLGLNARDAMLPEGTLRIAGTNVELTEADARMHPDARPGPYVLLAVADTGAGIPPDVLDRIFDPFFTTKEYGKGTGLGLATVLGIVKGHGGFILVSSEVGKGTRFSVYLPAVPSAPAVEPAPPVQAFAPSRKELVLVVDDEAFIRDITRRTLEAHGYRVLTAKEGREAVALYAKHRDDVGVVLTDMMMPGMDGPATIQALRQLDANVRIIAVSGQGGHSGSGVQAYLPKPYKMDRLLQTLAEVLQAGV